MVDASEETESTPVSMSENIVTEVANWLCVRTDHFPHCKLLYVMSGSSKIYANTCAILILKNMIHSYLRDIP